MDDDFDVGTPEWSLDPRDWHFLDGGFAIPREFTARAQSRAGWTAEVLVEISDGKARTRSITMATDAPEGVTAALVRRVKIRPIVARGALNLLRRPRVAKDGSTKFAPFTLEESEEAYAVLERIVGYVDAAEAAEAVAARSRPIAPRKRKP